MVEIGDGVTTGNARETSDHDVALGDVTGTDGALEDLDRLSLEQALRDVDLANARVLDLTQRLLTAQREAMERQVEVDLLRAELAKQRADDAALRRSRAFRTADKYWAILRALRQ